MHIQIAAPLALALLFAPVALRAGDDASSKITVEAIGVRVARPNAVKERVLWPAGTTVLLLMSSTAGDLIHFDATDSALSKFVDDKGSDLQARPKDPGIEQIVPASFGPSPKIGKDARNCVIEFVAPALPAAGATRLLLQGTVSMLCATQKKETVVEKVVLKNETKIAGPNNLELQIAEVNEAERDIARDKMTFVLRAQRELEDVAEIKFFHPNGPEIKAIRTSTSTLAIQGDVKVDWSYTLPEKVDVVTVKLYTWSDLNKKRIKIDLSVDLGL